ncbi:MAG: DinB family protein [Flavitalea sp.]
MENNVVEQQAGPLVSGVFTPESLLSHWQGHRGLTRRVIEAFPENKLFDYSIGGMRPFAEMAKEMMGMGDAGVRGIVTGDWSFSPELDYKTGKSAITTKEELLRLWDKVSKEINTWWPLIPAPRFHETIKAFGQWEGEAIGIILYWIDNEIHHRGQGYVYLRSLGIEPPAFWNRGEFEEK